MEKEMICECGNNAFGVQGEKFVCTKCLKRHFFKHMRDRKEKITYVSLMSIEKGKEVFVAEVRQYKS